MSLYGKKERITATPEAYVEALEPPRREDVGRLHERIRSVAPTLAASAAEGMLTYGSLPDLLQDAVNVGVAPADLQPLLRSAQDYVDMWRKAYRVTGCDIGPATTDALFRRCAGAGALAARSMRTERMTASCG